MSKKGLNDLLREKNSYDKDSQAFIVSLSKEKDYLDKLDSMKRTEGWKILDMKIKEELQDRIRVLVKDDVKIQTLLALITLTDTKKQSQVLEGEIERLFPES